MLVEEALDYSFLLVKLHTRHNNGYGYMGLSIAYFEKVAMDLDPISTDIFERHCYIIFWNNYVEFDL